LIELGLGEEKRVDIELQKLAKIKPKRSVLKKEGWAFLGTYQNGAWIKQHFNFPKNINPKSMEQTSQIVSGKTDTLYVREKMPNLIGQKGKEIDILKSGDEVKIIEVKVWYDSGWIYAHIKYED